MKHAWNMAAVAMVAFVAVAACDSTPESLAKQQLSIAAMCTAYGKSLTELAPYRPKLDAKAVAVVESVRATLNPICLDAKAPSAVEAATTAAMSGLGQISTVLAIVKGP